MSENELLLCTVYEQALDLIEEVQILLLKLDGQLLKYILYNRAKDIMYK